MISAIGTPFMTRQNVAVRVFASAAKRLREADRKP
ncbi:hypothetical protein SAMN05428963_10726 [Consotaella salsifontis]|uniref:Uncharacterized protein n=1 Tax=Consotaella salsifontis TaxID=1365950 RepID=A0A1T4RL81_9HYPH|nr:hypothetical protein SAMN05428963_10726 [Consotaella salsifontis]